MIKIQNIYYMLSYAYQVLRGNSYAKCANEEFENTADLLSAILIRGVSILVKQGLGRDYIDITEQQSCPRGKINISDSVKKNTTLKKQLSCTYDEFSVNSYLNQIIKTTANLLLKFDISRLNKKQLRNLMLYFKDVDIVDWRSINWKQQFNRNNQNYRLLLNVCYLIIEGLLQTDRSGKLYMQKFLDEQHMSRLYEKFILEYYRKEHPDIKTGSSQIKWAVDDDFIDMLPKMQSDIMLKYNNKKLIIDAKYYTSTTQKNAYNDTRTMHSHNMYQIFTYVKNEAERGGEVAGMLLYAKTDEEIQPDHTYKMSGNEISVKTLDLDCDFGEIKEQLDSIVQRIKRSEI